MNTKNQMIQQLVKKNTENANKDIPCSRVCLGRCIGFGG
jgi:hypothetical protein